MQLITHQTHIDKLSQDKLAAFIIKRFEQLAEEAEDVPPIIVLVKSDDDITGPDYSFIGTNGLLSDLWEEHEPKEKGFVRPYEWVSYWSDLKLYEVLFLVCGEDGYWILIPEEIVEAHPDLKWVLAAGSLSEPQPL